MELERLRGKPWEKEQYEVFGKVFGKFTLMALYKMMNKGVFSELSGEVFSGKESSVFYAFKEDGTPLIIKIYRMETAIFKHMKDYITGDPRFRGLTKKKDLIYEWTKKEYRNLKRLRRAGLKVPEPYSFRANILVMEFIGNEHPAETLKKDPPKDPDNSYKSIIDFMKKAKKEAGLVHGDLSEYNILNTSPPTIIDTAQAVSVRHPRAKEFFERDLKNINNFFRKFDVGVEDLKWNLL